MIASFFSGGTSQSLCSHFRGGHFCGHFAAAGITLSTRSLSHSDCHLAHCHYGHWPINSVAGSSFASTLSSTRSLALSWHIALPLYSPSVTGTRPLSHSQNSATGTLAVIGITMSCVSLCHWRTAACCHSHWLSLGGCHSQNPDATTLRTRPRVALSLSLLPAHIINH